MKHLVLIARIVFGAWMLANGVNHFLGAPLYPEPVGHEPLSIQLMLALQHSRLLDVAMAIQLVTGAMILAGVFLPVALCVVMPISVCAAFWAVILEHQPVVALLALIAVALNALLCLAFIDYYQDMLARFADSAGETSTANTYANTYAHPTGRTAQRAYAIALLPLAAAFGFYYFLSHTGLNGQWVMATLLYPGIVLCIRRLHDMGQTGWLVVVPAALDVGAIAVHFVNALHLGKIDAPPALYWAAAVVSAAFVVWCLIGKSQAGDNRFGAVAA